MTPLVTRLAPSPTGALHLGNVKTFVLNWLLARRRGWRVVMRMDDLDGPRVKPDAAAAALDLLAWLGLDWDGPVLYQSADLRPYHAALETLDAAGRTYLCPATRREIAAAASAPHEDEHEQRYPGLYRPRRDPQTGRLISPTPPADADTAVRLIVPDREVAYVDEFAGPQSTNVQQHVGDFILQTKAGLPSYQLATVVDDARQGVTEVVRGEDLLRSVPRQLLLYEALELGPPPRYYHLPLVYGEDSHRLAKRHGDTRAAHYREQGVAAQRLLGVIGFWAGILPRREEATLEQLLERFEPDRHLPGQAVTFTSEDDRWLLD